MRRRKLGASPSRRRISAARERARARVEMKRSTKNSWRTREAPTGGWAGWLRLFRRDLVSLARDVVKGEGAAGAAFVGTSAVGSDEELGCEEELGWVVAEAARQNLDRI